jgi:hypothetical protein
VRCSLRFDWPVYPRLRRTIRGVNAPTQSGCGRSA